MAKTGFAAVEATTRALRRDINSLKRELAALKRQQRSDSADADAAAGAGGSYLRLSGPVHIEYVRISGPKDAAGWWPAKRQMGTPNINSVIDDDELTQIFKVFAVGEASPFVEAAGHILLWDALGTPAENYWQTMDGEWCGFWARLTDGIPDSNESYAWEMIPPCPYRQPLTHLSGSPALGRVFDYTFASRDPAVPTTSRLNYPANTEVLIKRAPTTQKMVIWERREIDSGPC